MFIETFKMLLQDALSRNAGSSLKSAAMDGRFWTCPIGARSELAQEAIKTAITDDRKGKLKNKRRDERGVCNLAVRSSRVT